MAARFVFGAGILLSASIASAAFAADASTLEIVISKDHQMLSVFDGAEIVATSRVSTGKPGHDTPSGIFSVLEKQKFHRSNKYSNAPMPWMQRITWSGVALHESNSVPKHPASHGCIRMPAAFARQLYRMTARGVNVVVADQQLAPEKLHGQSLFRPVVSPSSPLFMNDVAIRGGLTADGNAPVEVAMADVQTVATAAPDEEAREPIYILISRSETHDDPLQVQIMLNKLGYNAGDEDGFAGPLTRSAINKFKLDNGLPTDGKLLDKGFLTLLYGRAHVPLPQNGKLVIRRHFKEIYRAPVTIEQPETALGTHFMVARNVIPSTHTAEWFGMTLSNHIPARARERLGIKQDADTLSPEPAVAALDRIKMSDETRMKVGELLADGSALTITDVESKSETGPGTNFITITHRQPG